MGRRPAHGFVSLSLPSERRVLSLERRRTTGLPTTSASCASSARIDFKSRYTDAALGYVWSLAKPLAYFGVLWLVFGHLLRHADRTEDFALFLLIGVVLYMFFTTACRSMLPSIVDAGALLRRLCVPAVLIPLSASVAIGITFCVNLTAVAVFAAIQDVEPRLEWLLLLPLLVELYLFTVGLGPPAQRALRPLPRRRSGVGARRSAPALRLARSSTQSAILPDWAQKAAFLNPFVQVMQDVRYVVLGGASGLDDLTAADVYGGAAAA